MNTRDFLLNRSVSNLEKKKKNTCFECQPKVKFFLYFISLLFVNSRSTLSNFLEKLPSFLCQIRMLFRSRITANWMQSIITTRMLFLKSPGYLAAVYSLENVYLKVIELRNACSKNKSILHYLFLFLFANLKLLPERPLG